MGFMDDAKETAETAGRKIEDKWEDTTDAIGDKIDEVEGRRRREEGGGRAGFREDAQRSQGEDARQLTAPDLSGARPRHSTEGPGEHSGALCRAAEADRPAREANRYRRRLRRPSDAAPAAHETGGRTCARHRTASSPRSSARSTSSSDFSASPSPAESDSSRRREGCSSASSMVNPLHNIAHLLIGAALLIAGLASAPPPRPSTSSSARPICCSESSGSSSSAPR